MAMITIYDKNASSFSGNGIGVLWPDSCVVNEEANGQYEIDMVHPMTDDMRYMLIEVDRILRVPVPKRYTPYAAILSNTVTYSVISNRYLHSRPDPASPALELLKAGDTVTLMQTGASYHLVTSSSGTTGWALASNLSYLSTVAGAPDESKQTWQERYQLFRIYRVEKDTKALNMRVYARHISYDLIWRTLRACDMAGLTMQQALDKLSAQAQPPHGFELKTDTARKVTVDCSMMNAIEALLDPDLGLANQGKPRLEVIRDNYTIWLLEDGGKTRNDPIMHGRNLLGAEAEINYDNVCNRIFPVGQNADGAPLWLDSPYYIDSPDIETGDIIRAKTIEYHDVKVGSKDENDVEYTIETARAALTAKAQEEFSGGIDKPQYNLRVDFVLLGDTEEFAAYRGLDRLYLWDSVRIIDSLHSIEITADVTGYEYDVLAGRYTQMTLGTTSGERGIRLISGYQIRQGSIPGSKLIHQTLGPGQIGPGYMEQVATNATGQQITIEFTSGVILDDDNTSTVGTLKVYHNGIDITDLIPASAVHWQRISSDTAGDALWNADPAHQNTKTVTINAADVDWMGILRCSIDESRLYSTPTFVDGKLVMEDDGSGDSALWDDVDGKLVYTGDLNYIDKDGTLLIPQTFGAFVLDTQLSNLKTSYINISRRGIEIYGSGFVDIKSGGEMNIEADGAFNLRAGTASKSIGMSNNHIDEWFLWAGAASPASAPFRVDMQGRIWATNLQQVYSQSFWDMADDAVPAEFSVYIPSGYTMDSVAFTFKTGKARTFAKSAAAGGAAEKTSRSGGGVSSTVDQNVGNTGEMTAVTNTHGPSVDNTGSSSRSNTGLGGSHSHSVAAISDNAPTSNAGNHTHTGPAHVHTGPSHRHSFSDTSGSPSPTISANTTATAGVAHNHGLNAHTHSVSGDTGYAGTGNTGESGTGATGADGGHRHTFTVKAHDTGGAADHNHGMAHTHSLGAHTHQMGVHWHNMEHTHNFSISSHTHIVDIDAHTHDLDYGINEKTALATSCVLKVNDTTIGTYSPNPANVIEIKTHLAAGWNTITVQPNDDARISAYVMVKITAN